MPKPRATRKGVPALVADCIRRRLPAALAEQADAKRTGRDPCWALCRERTGLIAEARRAGVE